MMHITKNAALHIRKFQDNKGSEDDFFRVSAHSGCGGFEYHVGFDRMRENDLQMESSGTHVLMDMETDSLTENVELDYSDESGSFVFRNAPEYPGCGCGGSCGV
ncbi:hypothetical protein MNBD_NITROSPINAE02-1871 [hydrothermal vent metagenome]|uniref:Core domain-containing protein n=1 Tax=hydrothermal vent metagenome TaxID=652676 RepID=A0A3B1C607_9ZZZZ